MSEIGASAPRPCDRCGEVFDAQDLHPLNRIEEVVLDYAATVEDGPSSLRGRRRWFTPAARDPRVIVSTPRYQYVHASYRLCPDCFEESMREEQTLSRFQQRATTSIAVAVALLGLLLIAAWILTPSLYTAVGLRPATPQGPPPTTQPYKPPFDAATPTASH